jgi:multicomponent Na+:H+ antiporter subunit E
MKITPALLLLAFWLVLTEKLTLERLLVGIAAVGLVMLLNAEIIKPKRAFARRLRAGALFDFLWLYTRMVLRLVFEIFAANIHVAAIVLRPKLKLSPSVVTLRTPLKSQDDRVFLANAITLTPGTLTLDLQKDILTVHCLDAQSAEGLSHMKIEAMLLQREKEA